MSAHRPRPRSGQFTFDGHALRQLHSEEPLPRSPPSRRSSAPFSWHESPALITDSGSSGGGSGSGGVDSREQRQQQQQQQGPQQKHRRVVSVSWPGDVSFNHQWHGNDKDDGATNHRNEGWEQHLQRMMMSRRSSSISRGTTMTSADEEDEDDDDDDHPPAFVGLGAGPAPAPAPIPAPAPAVTVNLKVVPNKRQRQTAFSAKRVSSGPIDIPPSPRTTAGIGDGRGGVGEMDERGARAITDAGEWYPCWSPSRPDDKKCGEGGGPPEHILIWERQAKRSASQQQQQQLDTGGAGGGAGGAGRADVVEEDGDSESEDDEARQGRPERKLSSDQYGSTTMLFEMDM